MYGWWPIGLVNGARRPHVYVDNVANEGCSGDSLQDIGWSGRHPQVERPGGSLGTRALRPVRNSARLPRDALLAGLSSGRPSAPFPHHSKLSQPGGSGGIVFLKVALLLLGAWVLGVAGVYNAGTLVHVLLLVGLMLLL